MGVVLIHLSRDFPIKKKKKHPWFLSISVKSRKKLGTNLLTIRGKKTVRKHRDWGQAWGDHWVSWLMVLTILKNMKVKGFRMISHI
jgi:hypothetical protein